MDKELLLAFEEYAENMKKAADTLGKRIKKYSGPANPPDTTPPPIPQWLAVSGGNTTASLAWTPVADPSSPVTYILRRGGNIVYEGQIALFEDSGLTNGTEYSYTVSAKDAAGNQSAQSDPVLVTPSAPPPPPDPEEPPPPDPEPAVITGDYQLRMNELLAAGSGVYLLAEGEHTFTAGVVIPPGSKWIPPIRVQNNGRAKILTPNPIPVFRVGRNDFNVGGPQPLSGITPIAIQPAGRLSTTITPATPQALQPGWYVIWGNRSSSGTSGTLYGERELIKLGAAVGGSYPIEEVRSLYDDRLEPHLVREYESGQHIAYVDPAVCLGFSIKGVELDGATNSPAWYQHWDIKATGGFLVPVIDGIPAAPVAWTNPSAGQPTPINTLTAALKASIEAHPSIGAGKIGNVLFTDMAADTEMAGYKRIMVEVLPPLRKFITYDETQLTGPGVDVITRNYDGSTLVEAGLTVGIEIEDCPVSNFGSAYRLGLCRDYVIKDALIKDAVGSLGQGGQGYGINKLCGTRNGYEENITFRRCRHGSILHSGASTHVWANCLGRSVHGSDFDTHGMDERDIRDYGSDGSFVAGNEAWPQGSWLELYGTTVRYAACLSNSTLIMDAGCDIRGSVIVGGRLPAGAHQATSAKLLHIKGGCTWNTGYPNIQSKDSRRIDMMIIEDTTGTFTQGMRENGFDGTLIVRRNTWTIQANTPFPTFAMMFVRNQSALGLTQVWEDNDITCPHQVRMAVYVHSPAYVGSIAAHGNTVRSKRVDGVFAERQDGGAVDESGTVWVQIP